MNKKNGFRCDDSCNNIVVNFNFEFFNPLRCILNYLKLFNCWCNCHKAIFQFEYLPREVMNTRQQNTSPQELS